jgi:galactokinase
VTNTILLSTITGFRQKYDREPTGVWSAPGRVNLIGEHTDYNEGFVFPFAINRRTYAAIAERQDNMICVASSFSKEAFQISIDDIKQDDSNGWASYPFGVVYAVAKLSGKKQTQGFDIFIDSDVPVGAGLSSSAAIECAVSTAINELWATGLSIKDLAKAGQLGENEIVGAPTGIMDQTASLFGQLDSGVFIDCQSLDVAQVELGFATAGLELLIIDTKVAHRLVDGGYAARRAACELGASTLGVSSLRGLSEQDLPRAHDLLDATTFRRVRHVVTENSRVQETVKTLKQSGPAAIGQLLHASHESMRDDFEISIDELDTAVETSMRHGAIGARMTGGGFGGAAIALTPISKISEVTLSVIAEFEALGYAKPDIFAVSAADGARRENLPTD